MSKFIKVEGHSSLVRDTYTNGIVNTNVSEYQIYMNRVKSRETQGAQTRSAVKEINTLKAELREIKNLLKDIVK